MEGRERERGKGGRSRVGGGLSSMYIGIDRRAPDTRLVTHFLRIVAERRGSTSGWKARLLARSYVRSFVH